MWRGRIKLQDVDVSRDPRLGVLLDFGRAEECVAAIECCAVVLEALTVHIDRRAGLPRAGAREREIGSGTTAPKRAAVRFHVPRRGRGSLVYDVNHTDERRGAICHRCGAAKDLDAIDITEAHRRYRGIERATPRHIVHDQQKRVKLAQSPDLGHRTGRP